MTASLPMYWRPDTAAAWRRLWDLVQMASKVPLPPLIPPEDLPADWHAHWLDPDLHLSMTCGLPLRTALRGQVQYVATLSYDLPGPPGSYYSRLIGRPGLRLSDKRLRLAYNAADSQSGWAVAQNAGAHVPHLRIGSLIETGAHAASFQAVAEGRADVAYLDAITWRLLKLYDGAEARVDLIGRTDPTPGLPLITALGRDVAPLRAALRDAVTAVTPTDRRALGGLTGVAVLDEAAYFDMSVPKPPDLAALR